MRVFTKPLRVDEFIAGCTPGEKYQLKNAMEEAIATRPDDLDKETMRLIYELLERDLPMPTKQ
jgi:hypothetical protein